MMEWTINIWNDFFGTWDGDPAFPFEYHFENGDVKTAHDKDELLGYLVCDLGDRPSAAIWELILVEKKCQNLVRSDEVQNYVSQYNYCKEMSVAPFPGAYQDQPAEWVDFVSFLSSEMPKCFEAKRKRNG
jgi:hypothetical protein